jgi:hypothetical protein
LTSLVSTEAELRGIQDSGIRFTLQPQDGRFVVRLGDYRQKSDAEAILPTMEEAVTWLREQVKFRYPDSAYARRLLTN